MTQHDIVQATNHVYAAQACRLAFEAFLQKRQVGPKAGILALPNGARLTQFKL